MQFNMLLHADRVKAFNFCQGHVMQHDESDAQSSSVIYLLSETGMSYTKKNVFP